MSLRVTYKPSIEEVREARRLRYVELWPTDCQMEAHAEAAMGCPEKLDRMMGDFDAIRKAYPFFDES